MGHISILCDDLQSVDSLIVSHNLIKEEGSVLLYPTQSLSIQGARKELAETYHGSS